MVGDLRHQVRVVAVAGAGEEMGGGTARVLSAGPLPLLAGMRGQTARLAAVVLGVPETALVVTVVVPTDQGALTLQVTVTVALVQGAEVDTISGALEIANAAAS